MAIDSVIKQSHVMVVGCGALGNEVMKNLALMGVGHLVIVDFDYVEQGNLTRSVLYRRSDVGEKKVDVAKRALLDINPHLDVRTIFGDVAYDVGLGMVRRMDVVVGCVDNRWARYCIQRLCHRAGKTWIDGGILDLTGTVKTFLPGTTCYACSLSTEALQDMQRRMPCSGVIRRREEAGHAPTTPIIASIIGAVQAQEAICQIEHRRRKTMLCYDGDSMTVMTPIFEAWDEDCALHGEWHTDQTEDGRGWIYVADDMLDDTIGNILAAHSHSTIILNEPFVDYIVSRKTDQRHQVMVPAHRVEDVFTHSALLRGELMSSFYQHEYREIDDSFPYPELTLREMGIPGEEILRMKNE